MDGSPRPLGLTDSCEDDLSSDSHFSPAGPTNDRTGHPSGLGVGPDEVMHAPSSTTLLDSSALESEKSRMLAGESEAVRVPDGTSAVVVVEVDVHILAGVPEVSETTGPIARAVRP